MAEYVEKAAFREHLDSVPPFTKYGQRDPKYDFAKTVFLSELAAYPAADVAPVRHGRYIGEYDGYADGCPVFDMWYCSECGYYFEEWDEMPTYNYCPNCGAKMDKEEE